MTVSDTTSDVRRVRPDEWEALRDIRLAALADAPDAFATTLAEARARPDEWWRGWAQRSAEGRDQAMFLAWAGGVPVGIAGVFRDGGVAYVIAMWTASSARRRGVARALLDAAVAFARPDPVRLSVTETNTAARALYEKYGFASTGATQPLREHSPLLVHELELGR